MRKDRLFLRWHQALERQAQARNEKRDKDKLLRGSDLIEAIGYLDKRYGGLNQLERGFVVASKDRRRWERQGRALLIGGGAAVLGLALLKEPTATTVENFANITLPDKRGLLINVEALEPGVHINVYKKTYGEPKYIRHNGVPTILNLFGVKTIKENIFVTKYFYLDAVTDGNDEVKFFAVTITDEAFNPTFTMPVCKCDYLMAAKFANYLA